MQRIFIVGCPRSGTTIVQAMLARHPQVLTLPETALFERLYGDLSARWCDRGVSSRPRLGMQLGFARQGGRRALARLQWKLGAGTARAPLRMGACVERFVQLLDDLTVEAGRNLWIEKTPNHLLYIPEIERHVPEARFVHVVRHGLDVLASIADANLHYDDNHDFGGDAKLWANRWNQAVAIHRRYIGRPNHHVVFLEDFVRDTTGEWRRLCHALTLDPEAPLDQVCGQSVADLADEPWKRQAVHGWLRPPRSKAQALFGPELLSWLSQRLVTLEPLRRQQGRDRAGKGVWIPPHSEAQP